MKTIIDTIKKADEVEIDGMFGVLKYKSIGILRKLKVMALILDLDEETVIKEAPKDGEGRVLDHVTRHEICDALIARAQQQTEKH